MIHTQKTKTAHAYQSPSGGSSSSTFYVAFNTPPSTNDNKTSAASCGIVATQVATSVITTIELCSSNTGAVIASSQQRQIQAFSVLPSPLNDGVWIYILFSSLSSAPSSPALTADNNNVQLIKWTSNNNLAASSAADELFFSVGSSSSSSVNEKKNIMMHSLKILWPNVNFAPTFLALMESQQTYGDAQNILHPKGPPLLIQVADNMQRTFTAIQGMPALSHPSLLSATGTGIGSALLVASYGTSIFTIQATRCSLTSSNIPRYWDGKQCINHLCARARSCAGSEGQIWFGYFIYFILILSVSNNIFIIISCCIYIIMMMHRNSSNLRCTCRPGYYSTAAGCIQCQIGYYCPGGDTPRISCLATASMTTLYEGSIMSTDCVCRIGQYFTSSSTCADCPAGQWCPNQWNANTCPGTADPSRSAANLVYPKGCVCAPGFSGAKCEACPPLNICPQGHFIYYYHIILS